ncbi:hypothetical protein [Micromonospora sp. HK10]|uniref:hypothetical protein n=1 Tax=Micromonospora sp. HK10 TaxID=1538294 RepID=UPI0012E1759E|nr:hypothetical protein [Micromonospora sp. HK10]
MTLAACTPTGSADHGQAPTSARADPRTSLPADGSSAEPCSTSVEALREPPAGYRLVGEDVAVPDRAVLEAQESGEADPAARLFAKWGLVVRGGAVIDLRVAPGWADRARIGWGTVTVPGPAARVRACSPVDPQSAWLAFAGGTWVSRATCLPLIVESRGRTAQVRLGIGVSCGGTDPPRS